MRSKKERRELRAARRKRAGKVLRDIGRGVMKVLELAAAIVT